MLRSTVALFLYQQVTRASYRPAQRGGDGDGDRMGVGEGGGGAETLQVRTVADVKMHTVRISSRYRDAASLDCPILLRTLFLCCCNGMTFLCILNLVGTFYAAS